MLKHNSYFDGNVQSVGFSRHGLPATVGAIAPGEYRFNTGDAERMTVVSGQLPAERVAVVGDWAELNEAERAVLAGQGLTPSQADLMIENVVGTYALPLGIAVNFLINGRDYLIPMAVEEPSVLAAISHAAKLIRAGGGFRAESNPLSVWTNPW